MSERDMSPIFLLHRLDPGNGLSGRRNVFLQTAFAAVWEIEEGKVVNSIVQLPKDIYVSVRVVDLQRRGLPLTGNGSSHLRGRRTRRPAA